MSLARATIFPGNGTYLVVTIIDLHLKRVGLLLITYIVHSLLYYYSLFNLIVLSLGLSLSLRFVLVSRSSFYTFAITGYLLCILNRNI